jgi:hypothetical protein
LYAALRGLHEVAQCFPDRFLDLLARASNHINARASIGRTAEMFCDSLWRARFDAHPINSAIDSGTNGYAFSDTTIPTTGEWCIPSSAISLSATMEATNGKGSPVVVPFSIGNAANAMASGYAAYDNVGM